MRVAIGFEKREPVRFVSHLDLQRALQRALRRSGLPLAYSQGFHPHPLVSLASALAVGAESRDEYLEAQLEGELTAEEIRARLEPALPPGLRLTGVAVMPEGCRSLMAAVGRVDYAVGFLTGWTQGELDAFLAREEIVVQKRSKKGMRPVDIRPMIQELQLNGEMLFMRLTHGENWSVRPELVMDALCAHTGHPAMAWRICRLAMYAGREGTTVPLLEAVKEGNL